MCKFREIYWRTVIIKEEIVSMLSCLRAYYKKEKRKTNAGMRTKNENNRSIFLLNRAS